VKAYVFYSDMIRYDMMTEVTTNTTDRNDRPVAVGGIEQAYSVITSAGKSNQLDYFVKSTSNWPKVTPLQSKSNSQKS